MGLPGSLPQPAVLQDADGAAVLGAGDRLLTRDFLLVMGGSAGGWLAHSMAQWAIAPFLVGLGFDPALGGLGLGVVAVSALASRVVVGPRIDRSGGRTPAAVGTALLAAAGVAYLLAALVGGGSLAALLLAFAGTAFQGVGFGAMTTASLAVVDDVAPHARRGEALGYFGVSQPIVQGLGATASFAILAAGGFATLFLTIAVTAALTVALFAGIRPVAPHGHGPTPSLRRAGIPRSILLPIVVCSQMSFLGGAMILCIPLLGLEAGISNPGVFYLASAVLGVTARLVTGRASDRVGRSRVAAPGLALLTVTMIGLALTAGAGMAAFVVAGALHGIASAAALPSLQALVLDRSPADRRGTGSAAMGMAFDIGFGTGSVVTGAVAGAASPAAGLMVGAMSPVVGIGTLLLDAWLRRGRP
jgi:MFS family permease